MGEIEPGQIRRWTDPRVIHKIFVVIRRVTKKELSKVIDGAGGVWEIYQPDSEHSEYWERGEMILEFSEVIGERK